VYEEVWDVEKDEEAQEEVWEKCPECRDGEVVNPVWKEFIRARAVYFRTGGKPGLPYFSWEARWWRSKGFYFSQPDILIPCPRCGGKGAVRKEPPRAEPEVWVSVDNEMEDPLPF